MIDPLELDRPGVSLRHHFDVIRRRKWILVVVAAVAIGAAAAFSFLAEPVYRASTQIVVGQGNSLFQPGEAGAIEPFTATMSNLVGSHIVASRVIEQLELDASPEELLQQITISFRPESAVIDVEVRDPNPERARDIADTIGTVFSGLIEERFGRPGPLGAEGGNPPLTAAIWDPAHVDPLPVSPRPLRNLALASALGLVFGILAAFLREHFDRTLRSREAVEQRFGVPVIGQIPFRRSRRRERRRVYWDGSGEGAEAYRALRANLQYLAVERPLRALLVTSASAEQGKTTVTANLALAIARSGATTIVVEGDLRRPRLNDAMGLAGQRLGLTNVLIGAVPLETAVIDVPLPRSADGGQGRGGVAFLPSGPLPPNPSELLSSAQMRELLAQLIAVYDYVLIDSPPLLPVADALEFARIVDGVMLVVRRNRSTTDEAREVQALVDRLGIHLLGVVFTDVESRSSYGGYGSAETSEFTVASAASAAGGLRRERSEAR